MDNLFTLANKPQDFEDEFYSSIYANLSRAFSNSQLVNGRLIPFPVVFSFFSWRYRFDKQTAKKVLHELSRRGWIELVKFHGIKLKTVRKK